MITIPAPYKASKYQVVDFGSITFEYPTKAGGQPSTSTGATIDEIIVSNRADSDINGIDFIKRYNTWFAYTNIQQYAVKPYNIIFISYDRTNRVAYTHSAQLLITPYDP
jgi:hypothetical protein